MAKSTAAPTAKPVALITGHKATVMDLLAKMREGLRSAAPASFRPETDRLIQIAWSTIPATTHLAECTQRSFLAALYQCSKTGLYPSDVRGLCYFIPRRTGPIGPDGKKAWECHFQMGYRGYLELARRSSEIVKIEARVVRAGDAFDYELGTKPFIHHRPPDLGKAQERDIIGSYAAAWLRSAPDLPQIEVLEGWELAKIRSVSAGAEYQSSPWVQWPEEMSRKCPVPRLCKYLPASDEMIRAAKQDELSMAGLRQEELQVEAKEALGFEDAGAAVEHQEDLYGAIPVDSSEVGDKPSAADAPQS